LAALPDTQGMLYRALINFDDTHDTATKEGANCSIICDIIRQN
jgi:hypothetical protein